MMGFIASAGPPIGRALLPYLRWIQIPISGASIIRTTFMLSGTGETFLAEEITIGNTSAREALTIKVRLTARIDIGFHTGFKQCRVARAHTFPLVVEDLITRLPLTALHIGSRGAAECMADPYRAPIDLSIAFLALNAGFTLARNTLKAVQIANLRGRVWTVLRILAATRSRLMRAGTIFCTKIARTWIAIITILQPGA
tara:strand:- start:237 stop:833 length:597 start_codon:yes stop_codon:yes gene_type:complete